MTRSLPGQDTQKQGQDSLYRILLEKFRGVVDDHHSGLEFEGTFVLCRTKQDSLVDLTVVDAVLSGPGLEAGGGRSPVVGGLLDLLSWTDEGDRVGAELGRQGQCRLGAFQ